jgi:endogenous inhibitor of DNA gyrase (YacG/DUF329 family)
MKEVSFQNVKKLDTKPLKVRGWKVREKKEVLIRLEGAKTGPEIFEVIQDLAKSCMKDPKVVDGLSDNELKNLICNMRKISEGSTIDFVFTCPHCKEIVEHQEVDLTKDVEKKAFNGKPIKVNDGQYVFNIHEISATERLEIEEKFGDEDAEFNFEYLARSITNIQYNDKNYSEFATKEVKKFIEDMNVNPMKELLKKFKDQMGYFFILKKDKCPECQKDVTVTFKDNIRFFVL